MSFTVKVRGATTLHWVKNGIALKEGADGGRIKGVATPTLTFTHLLGRDADQKVWCIAENKWGKVESSKAQLRTERQPDESVRKESTASTAGCLPGQTPRAHAGNTQATKWPRLFWQHSPIWETYRVGPRLNPK